MDRHPRIGHAEQHAHAGVLAARRASCCILSETPCATIEMRLLNSMSWAKLGGASRHLRCLRSFSYWPPAAPDGDAITFSPLGNFARYEPNCRASLPRNDQFGQGIVWTQGPQVNRHWRDAK